MAELPKRRKLEEVLTEKNKFSDLNDEEKKQIVEKKNIIFQGCETNLNDLLSPLAKYDLDDIISPDILSKLFNGEKIAVGREVEHFFTPKNEYYYIPRTVRNLDSPSKLTFPEKVLTQPDGFYRNPIVIGTSGTNGTGKSTFLTSLAESIKKKRPNEWVLVVDLASYTKSFFEFKKSNLKFVTLLDLLNSKPESKLSNDLERKMFSIPGKVLILLDGIDEVHPDHRGIVLDIIQNCKNKSGNLYSKNPLIIMASTNSAQDIGLKLSYTLEPLSATNQVEFLKMYWERKFHLIEIDKKKRCEIYAKTVIHDEWFQAKWKDSVGVPMLLQIVAEILEKKENFDDGVSEWEGCYEFLRSDNAKPLLPRKLTLVELCQLYIYKNLSEGTRGQLSSVRSDIAKINSNCDFGLQVLALKTTLDEKICNYFDCFKTRTGNVCEEQFKIVKLLDDEVQFVHKMFGEYFVAESISEELRGHQGEHFIDFFLGEVLMTDRFSLVRAFFNSFIPTDMNFLPEEVFTVIGHSLNHKDYNYLLNISANEGSLSIFKFLLRCCKAANITINLNDVTTLHSVLENNQHEIVKYLIENGIDVDTRNDKDRTALFLAATTDNLPLVKLLVERGAQINCKDYMGFTVFHEAARNSIELMKYLLEHGADVNSRSGCGQTALNIAVLRGDIKKVSYLLENGAKIYKSYRSFGNGLLSDAIMHGNLDLVKYLVAKGVDITEMTLHVVPYQNFTRFQEIVQYLLNKGVDINSVWRGDTVLYKAVHGASIECIKYLVEQGASLPLSYSSTSPFGRTLLAEAICRNDVNIVGYLMENGVKFNVKKESDLLYQVIKNRRYDIVRCLGKHGVYLDVKNCIRRSSLQRAIRNDDLPMIKILVDNGVKIRRNILCEYIDAFSVNALPTCSLATVKFLVENGAYVSVKFHQVTCDGNLDVVKFLLEKGATFSLFYSVGNNLQLLKFLFHKNIHVAKDEVFWEAVQGGYLDIVKFLTEKGLDVNLNVWDDDERDETALHEAAKRNHFYIVKYLLEHGACIDAKDVDHTLLYDATVRGCLESVKVLLENGANVGYLMSGNKSYRSNAVVEALRRGYFDTVKLLVELSVTLHVKSDTEDSILCVAFHIGRPDIAEYLSGKRLNLGYEFEDVKRLLDSDSEPGVSKLLDAIFSKLSNIKYFIEKGVEINTQLINRQKLLLKAMEEGDMKLLKHLVSSGCDVNVQDSSGCTALHKTTDLNITKLLVQNGGNVAIKDSTNHSVLYKAIEKGNLNLCKFLVENGADINEVDEEGHTLLHMKTYKYTWNISIDKIKYLVEKGVTFKLTNNGRNVLHDAIVSSDCDLDLLKYFIKKGVDVNGRDDKNRTPLDEAVSTRHLDVVDLLIENGAVIEIENTPGKLGLIFEAVKNRYGQCWNTSLEVVQYLVRKRASVNSKDETGSSLLQRAVAEQNMHIVKYLVDSGADVNGSEYSPLHEASAHKDFSFVKYLLEKGARIDTKTTTGRTVLHEAALSGTLTTVKFLVENGADVNICDADGFTPLLLVKPSSLPYSDAEDFTDSTEVAEFLIQKGASVNARTRTGVTPMHKAAEKWETNHAYLLLENGADINAGDELGRTPLFYVIKGSANCCPLAEHKDVVRFFVKHGADLESRAEDGRTVLHEAALSRDEQMVELLAELLDEIEADVDPRAEGDRTPLHDAARCGALGVVQCLVEKGADVEAKTTEGCTALDEAVKGGHDLVVKFLSGCKSEDKGDDIPAV